MYTYTHTWIHTFIHTRIHACIYAYTDVLIHRYTSLCRGSELVIQIYTSVEVDLSVTIGANIWTGCVLNSRILLQLNQDP